LRLPLSIERATDAVLLYGRMQKRLLCLVAAALCAKLALADAVGNAATTAPFPSQIAPGSLATYYGANLAPSAMSATTVPLPILLNGTSVSVNGTMAPLLYVSPAQINFQVPSSVSPGTATVIVTTQGAGKLPPVSATISAVSLGFFRGPTGVAAQNQDYTTNNLTYPAKPGTVLALYANGLGLVTNPVPDGQPASSSTLSSSIASVSSATVDTTPARVLFAGLAPGFIGLDQINILVPNVAAGVHYVSITMPNGQTTTGPIVIGQSIDLPPGAGTAPSVQIDLPLPGSVITGPVMVSGSAINVDSITGTDPVTSVQILVDGASPGLSAIYGISRPEVCALYPGRPNCPNVGFQYQLDTTHMPAGRHTIQVVANDSSWPLLTGSASTTINVIPPVSVSPNNVTVPIGATLHLYANRSVYWSKPALGTLLNHYTSPPTPLPANLSYADAIYQAPAALTKSIDTFTVTDAQDPSQIATVTLSLASVASLQIAASPTPISVAAGQAGQISFIVSDLACCAPTSGQVTVSVVAPPGLDSLLLSGTGWSCSGTNCTRADTLNGGSAYPPITFTFQVAASAAPLLVGNATLTGGGSSAASTNFTVEVR
jgi:uncharacterized protein (TIGR03437 family)